MHGSEFGYKQKSNHRTPTNQVLESRGKDLKTLFNFFFEKKKPNTSIASLNEDAADKFLKYRTDYNNNPLHEETDRFFAASGVQPA